ncbi:MAG: hypothetical protein H0W70_10255 [Actinobacteria bacterium]|nr:hypothetical protein [Actinomycetota bacterium]
MTVVEDTDVVMATYAWPSNAELIAACARLGYLKGQLRTLDATYGKGTFWKQWRPDALVTNDIDPESDSDWHADFRVLPFAAGWFDAVVLDPPYKLNGTPTEAVDRRYGVDVVASRRDRMQLIRDGITECARVLGGGYLLLKCQDQVNGGKVRWQTIDFTEHAERCGLGLVDRLDILSYRPQPEGRRQVHARRGSSSLLVFKRGWSWRDDVAPSVIGAAS